MKTVKLYAIRSAQGKWWNPGRSSCARYRWVEDVLKAKWYHHLGHARNAVSQHTDDCRGGRDLNGMNGCTIEEIGEIQLKEFPNAQKESNPPTR